MSESYEIRKEKCKQFRKGDAVLIVGGDDASGDVVQIFKMRQMLNSGKIFKIDDIADDGSYLHINHWWFDPKYVVHAEGIKNPSPKKIKPTLFDETQLVT